LGIRTAISSGFQRIRRAFTLLAVLSLLATSLFTCSGQNPGGPPEKEAVPVTAATVVQKTVPVQLRAIGNVEAYSTVSVRSQVNGELMGVYFKEGQDVNKGALLFTIDPRPYEAALTEAEATLAKDTAQFENARREVGRFQKLFEEGLISQDQFDQISTNASALEATVNADRAVVENARLRLEYCVIRSPITGRTGNLMVHPGNLIEANDESPMVVINQIQPIYVTFSVPEQHLPEIRKYRSSGTIAVEAFTTEGGDKPEEGMLVFVDNAVDVTTGTIKLKASFDNANRRLWPGQFADVVMTLTTQPDAVVVASQAIQTGASGQYVFVIRDDLTVESRSISVGRTLDGEAVVEKGLQLGEKVVTDGQLRLVPGAKVDIRVAAESGD